MFLPLLVTASYKAAALHEGAIWGGGAGFFLEQRCMGFARPVLGFISSLQSRKMQRAVYSRMPAIHLPAYDFPNPFLDM